MTSQVSIPLLFCREWPAVWHDAEFKSIQVGIEVPKTPLDGVAWKQPSQKDTIKQGYVFWNTSKMSYKDLSI